MRIVLAAIWLVIAGLLFLVWDIKRHDVLMALVPSLYTPGADARGTAYAVALVVTILKGVVAIGPIVWIWQSKRIGQYTEEFKKGFLDGARHKPASKQVSPREKFVTIWLGIAGAIVAGKMVTDHFIHPETDYAECVFSRVPNANSSEEARASRMYCSQVFNQDIQLSDAMTKRQCVEKYGSSIKVPVGLSIIEQACIKKYGTRISFDELQQLYEQDVAKGRIKADDFLQDRVELVPGK